MDLTIVSTALYTIALEFGSLATSYWILLSYSLAEMGKVSPPTFPPNLVSERYFNFPV